MQLFAVLNIGEVTSFKMLAQIAGGVEGFDETLDVRITWLQGRCSSDTEKASAASLPRILHVDGSDRGTECVVRLRFSACCGLWLQRSMGLVGPRRLFGTA